MSSARRRFHSARRDVLETIKRVAKAEKISEDEVKSIEGDIQKTIDGYQGNLDTILVRKEAEIMEV